MENKDCVFCKIISGEFSSYKIYENEYALAFLDISKDVYGHTLVVPKKHYENIFDCDEKYLSEVMKVVQKVANHYKSLGFKAVNILNASGKEAGQTVFHLHFHIMPKMEEAEFNAYPALKGTNIDLKDQQEKLKLQ